jgi:phage terminase large subunit
LNARIKLKYDPLEKQLAFHDSPAKFRLYAGGVGSGKSICGVAESIQQSLDYPQNYGLIARKTYPELEKSSWKELLDFPVEADGKSLRFIDSPLVVSYNKQKREVTLFNGSVIAGAAFEDDGFDKFAKGLNLGWLYVDELTEIAETMWDGLINLRLRRKVPCKQCGVIPAGRITVCPKCRIPTIDHCAWGTTNPEGHDWVWKKWVVTDNKKYWYIQATSDENPHLSQDYLDGLAEMPEEWQKRYRFGSFDVFAGLIYKDFQDRPPHVIEAFDIPKWWNRFVTIDYGYRNPTGVLWGAVSDDGRLVIYDEFYASGKLISEVSTIIKTKNDQRQEHIQLYLIDPSCSARDGKTGRSVIDEYSDYGIYCYPANNDVRAGINRVSEYLKIKDGKSKLQIFKNCVNLRTELQTYRWKDLRPGASQDEPERPLKKNDHLVDPLRYKVNYIYDAPKQSKPKGKGFDYTISRYQTEENWRAV